LSANVTRALVIGVVAVIGAAAVLFFVIGGSSDKKLTARFASAIGVYEGTPVRILGVNVGSVDAVHPKADYVEVVISYDSKTWSRTVYPFGSATPASGPAPRHETPAQGAARLRAEVASGELTLVGPARVDGQRAIELRQGTAARGMLRIWVSPDTYLPIRTVSTPPGVPASSPQAIRDDYTWLPSTAASRRQLTRAAAIPAGFRQVSPH